MMLPILISVSEAPVSYFFWASAPAGAKTNTTAASAAARRGRERVICPKSLPELANELLTDDRNLPGAMRHQVNDQEQQDAEHRARKSLGDAFGDVRHEDDEGRADERPGQPSDAADDHAEEQLDRK